METTNMGHLAALSYTSEEALKRYTELADASPIPRFYHVNRLTIAHRWLIKHLADIAGIVTYTPMWWWFPWVNKSRQRTYFRYSSDGYAEIDAARAKYALPSPGKPHQQLGAYHPDYLVPQSRHLNRYLAFYTDETHSHQFSYSDVPSDLREAIYI